MHIGGLAGDQGIRYFRPPNKRLQLALQALSGDCLCCEVIANSVAVVTMI